MDSSSPATADRMATDRVTTGSHPVLWSTGEEGPALVLMHGPGGDRAFSG